MRYVSIAGSESGIGNGEPFNCMFSECRKDKGKISKKPIKLYDKGSDFDWSKMVGNLAQVTSYLHKSIQATDKDFIAALNSDGHNEIPAVKKELEQSVAQKALNGEYKYLQAKSDRLHTEFKTKVLPAVSSVLSVEDEIIEKVRKDSNSKEFLTLTTPALSGGAIGGDLITSSIVGGSLLQSIQAEYDLSVFESTATLGKLHKTSLGITTNYDDTVLGLGKVNSLQELRRKIRNTVE